MFALLCFVLAVLASPFKSKSRLEAENAVLRHQLIVVCTENLNPGIVVMQSAEDGERFDVSGPLNRARNRRIFVQ